jgi:hypothetical protein
LVACFDENYYRGQMFFITDVDGTPKYEYVYTIGVAGTDYKCNYYTDNVGTMVLTLN